MSSTRSPSPPAPAIEALIVSHGSPSDPDPQERFVRVLAEQVARHSGIDVRGVTLAKKGALEAVVRGLQHPMIFPHFMADGWFVSTNLQNRLAAAGLSDWQTLTPLGLSDGLPEIARQRLLVELQQGGLSKGETTLVIAAHGSPSDPRPARATERFAEALQALQFFGAVRVGYVDEDPSLEDAARVDGPAILLPFFAARAGHVLNDLPEALEAAKFSGTVLSPIGTWDDIPQLIASSLQAQAAAA